MRLLVKQSDGTAKELEFEQGPISIGRGANNRVFLPDKGVSREHAVIRAMGGGKWMIEDLGSSNKTYLNDKVVHKAEIKHGDSLRITDFTLEVILENPPAEKILQAEDTLLHLEAALTTPKHETVVRKPDAQHAPAMRLAARRLSDFSKATEIIFNAGGIDELLLTLLDITLEQFNAYHVWCALRTQSTGPMTCH